MCERSLHSSVLSIAAAHGTRMQRELSNIIMTKNLHNPASPINKVFYPEHVYDDSSQEKPLIRWRIRSFYEETVAADSLNDTTSSKTLPSGSEPKERTRNPSGDASTGLGDLISDPLDCIFGYPEEGGETLHSDKAVVSRRALRAYKRQQRRHHARHHKNSAEHASTEILTI
uniref:Uncharacterized protein n=2 Tax=Anthurium amnicola TaxID=1678845 RepID=A0A1D1YM57_9ARAE